MNKIWMVLAALSILAAACGGDDSANEPTETPAADNDAQAAADGGAETSDDSAQADEPVPADDPEPEDEPEPTEPDPPADEPQAPAAPAEGATVSLNGEELVLEDAVVCITINDAIGGSFTNADRTLSLDIDLPPPDWETSGDDWPAPSIRLDDERNETAEQSWRAGGEVLASYSETPAGVAVTTWEFADRSASGTATVVELNALTTGDPTAVTEMAFTVSCGE